MVSEGTRALARVSQHIGLVDKVLSAREEAFLMPKMVVLVFEREGYEPLRLEVDRNIKELLLSDKKIKTLPIEIGELTNLTAFSLSRNKITQLPAEISKLINLTSLILYSNELTEFPAEITKLTNLISLILYSNQLTTLPNEINHLTKLTQLVLPDNSLSNAEKEKIKTLLPNCKIYFVGAIFMKTVEIAYHNRF